MASDTPRPSAFEHGGAFAVMCRADLVKCYKDDGNRLSEHPGATAIPPAEQQGPAAPSYLRVLQWNINCLCGAGGFMDAMSAHGIADRVADQVLAHSPDVCVTHCPLPTHLLSLCSRSSCRHVAVRPRYSNAP